MFRDFPIKKPEFLTMNSSSEHLWAQSSWSKNFWSWSSNAHPFLLSMLYGLSQNWCSLSVDGLVTPSIGIPTKRPTHIFYCSLFFYEVPMDICMSSRSRVTAGLMKTGGCTPSKNKMCKKWTKKWQECSMFRSIGSVKPGTDLCRGKSRRIHFCFMCWDKLRTNPHVQFVHDVRILGINSLSIRTWMLASTVHTTNRAKYMSTLRTYQTLPHFDGLKANGSGHAPCWGKLYHAVWLARKSTLALRKYRVTKKCFRQKFWNFIKKLFSIEEFL